MENSGHEDPFRVLSDPHRRRLLFTLVEHNPQMDLRVPDEVEFSGFERRDIEIALYHFHLPMLEDFGLIEWDENTNKVSKGPKFEGIRPLLEIIVGNRDELPVDSFESPLLTESFDQKRRQRRK